MTVIVFDIDAPLRSRISVEVENLELLYEGKLKAFIPEWAAQSILDWIGRCRQQGKYTLYNDHRVIVAYCDGGEVERLDKAHTVPKLYAEHGVELSEFDLASSRLSAVQISQLADKLPTETCAEAALRE